MKTLCEDSNGNKWYEFEGNIYGITTDGRVIDEDGIPLDSVESDENTRITEALLSE